ncbi:hypothetical protein OE88DRAFT_1626308 [Heliocybe sulcata]|uniref:Uncharacterized protein n=1 Tax=Heliocybe sulcata TaxID=5364 RepID=A0A5C3N7U2_9AGAM|nr:hypothetical protein OE88DRAFT_1626308 [Heliocybe sulcata]
MPRYDGPYHIIDAYPDKSMYTLDMPHTTNIHPEFHAKLLAPYKPNNPELFPDRELPCPGPIVTPDGEQEWTVERIIDQHRRGR